MDRMARTASDNPAACRRCAILMFCRRGAEFETGGVIGNGAGWGTGSSSMFAG
jgi:hypothetical protein